MNEKLLEQRAKDFIDRIKKESGGNWLDKYYLTDLLLMFATEETKLLSEHIRELIADKGKLIDENRKAREIIKEYVRLANLEKEDTVAIWQLYYKAEQFLGE